MGIARNAAKKMGKGGDEKFMNGFPTRMEVANYLNALLEEKYMPAIQNMVQMSAMVLQAMMIKKGICTGDELEELSKEFLKEHEKRMAAMNTINSTELLKEVLVPEYATSLDNNLKKLQGGSFSFKSSDYENEVIQAVTPAVNELKKMIDEDNHAVLTDDSREKILQGLVDVKRKIETNEIEFNRLTDKSEVMGMLWDAIIPFAHKKLGSYAAHMHDTPSPTADMEDGLIDKIDEVSHQLDTLEPSETTSQILAALNRAKVTLVNLNIGNESEVKSDDIQKAIDGIREAEKVLKAAPSDYLADTNKTLILDLLGKVVVRLKQGDTHEK